MSDDEFFNGQKVHDFNKSINVGKEAEGTFENLLKSYDMKYESNVNSGNAHPYDYLVYFRDIQVKVEIKNDARALDTGNLAFEVKSSNSKSGWFIEPRADIYIVYVGKSIYAMHRVDFKYIRERNCHKLDRLRTVVNKGYTSIVLTVPRAELERYKANDEDHLIRIMWGMVKNHHFRPIIKAE